MSQARRHRMAGAVGLAVVLAAVAGPATAKKKGEFFIQRAKLTKQADGSWTGHGTLDGVTGTVTITGTVVLLKQEPHNLHWSSVAGARRVEGCAREEVLTRPHGIQLWDGGGKITQTSAQERKYKGRNVALYGPTKASDLDHSQISIRELGPGPGPPPTKCR
jgi:hypothetical protein